MARRARLKIAAPPTFLRAPPQRARFLHKTKRHKIRLHRIIKCRAYRATCLDAHAAGRIGFNRAGLWPCARIPPHFRALQITVLYWRPPVGRAEYARLGRPGALKPSVPVFWRRPALAPAGRKTQNPLRNGRDCTAEWRPRCPGWTASSRARSFRISPRPWRLSCCI